MDNKSQSVTDKKDQFLDLIEKNKNKTFWIVTHDNPDPDAIASAFAIKVLLKFLGVSSEIFYHGEIDFRNSAMQNVLKIPIKHISNKETDKQIDKFVIFVDCASSKQQNVSIDFEPNIAIDHHKTLPDNPNTLFIHEDIGSCSALITNLIIEIEKTKSNKIFDPDDNDKISNLATALSIGIKTDTLDFTQEQTAEIDHEAYRFLIKLADKDKFKKIVNYELPPYVFESINVAWENRASKNPNFIAGLGFLDESRKGCISYLADLFMRLPGIQTALVYAVIGDQIICSGRTNSAAFDEQSLINAVFGQGMGGGKEGMFGAKTEFDIFKPSDMEDEDKTKLWELVKRTIEKRFHKFTEK